MSTVEEIDEMNDSFAQLLFGRYGEDNDDIDVNREEEEIRLFNCPRHGSFCVKTAVDEGLPCADAVDELNRWCVELKQARNATPTHRAYRVQTLNLRLQMVILFATMLGFGEYIDAASTDIKEMSEAISILQWNIACSVALIIFVLSLRHVLVTFSDCLRRICVVFETASANLMGVIQNVATSITTVVGTVNGLLPDVVNQYSEHLKWQRFIGIAQVGISSVGVLVQLVRLPMDWFARKTGVHLFEQQSRFNRKIYNGFGAFAQTVAATIMFIVVPFIGVAKALKWFDPLIKLLDKVPYATWLIDWLTRWFKGKASFDEAQDMVRDVVGKEPSDIFVNKEVQFATSAQRELWSTVKKHDHLECTDRCSDCVCKCHIDDKTEALKEDLHERSCDPPCETGGLGSHTRASEERDRYVSAMLDHNAGTPLSRIERGLIAVRTGKREVTTYENIPPGKIGTRRDERVNQVFKVYENCIYARKHPNGCNADCLAKPVVRMQEDVFLTQEEVAAVRIEAVKIAKKRGVLTAEEKEKYAYLFEQPEPEVAVASSESDVIIEKQSFKEASLRYLKGEIDEVELEASCVDENEKVEMAHLMFVRKHKVDAPVPPPVSPPVEPFERLEVPEENMPEIVPQKELVIVPKVNKWERCLRTWFEAIGATVKKVCPAVIEHVKQNKKKYIAGAATILLGAVAFAAAMSKNDGDYFEGEAKGKSKRGRFVFRRRVDVRRATKKQDHVESSGAEQDLETPDVSDNEERNYIRREKNLRAEDSYEEESVKPEPPPVEEPLTAVRRQRAVRYAKNRVMFATKQQVKDFEAKRAVLITPESTLGKMIFDPEIEKSIKSKVFKFKYDDEFTSSATLVSGKLCVPLHAHDADAVPSATNFVTNVVFKKDEIVPIAEDLGYFDTRGAVPKGKGWHMRETASGGEMVLAVYFKDPEAQEPSLSVGFAAPGGLHDAPTVKGACGGAIVAASDGALLGWPIGGGEKVNKYIPVTKSLAEVLLGQRKPQLQVFQ